jgi:hypothetical protein
MGDSVTKAHYSVWRLNWKKQRLGRTNAHRRLADPKRSGCYDLDLYFEHPPGKCMPGDKRFHSYSARIRVLNLSLPGFDEC